MTDAPTLSKLDTRNFITVDKYSPHQAAVLVDQKLEKSLIYNGNTFYEWNDYYWQPVPEIVIDRLSIALLDKWTRTKHSDFLKLLQVYCYQEININPFVVHLENFVFDLSTFKLGQPLTYKYDYTIGHLPITFEAGAEAPKWRAFLHEVMQGNEDKIKLVQEFFGYCFLGDNRYQQALVLLGAGNNGKSVLLEILSSLFDKVTYLDLKQIEDERYVHHIQGAWLNVASELQYKSMETTAYIKAVIAGEVIQAAPKYHKGFSFRPRAKIAFATNGLPRNNDTSQGYFRRLLIINMAYSVKNPNRNIIEELKKEIPGIFNWAIEGLQRLMNRGSFKYENPYVELYKEESSSLYAWWVEEGYNWMIEEQDGFLDITFKDFYDKYTFYCGAGGMRPSGRNKLRSELERLQIPVEMFIAKGNVKCVKLVASE